MRRVNFNYDDVVVLTLDALTRWEDGDDHGGDNNRIVVDFIIIIAVNWSA